MNEVITLNGRTIENVCKTDMLVVYEYINIMVKLLISAF